MIIQVIFLREGIVMENIPFDKECLKNQIQSGFDYLTEKEQLILILLYYEDCSIAEVCQILDLTFGEYVNISTNAKTKMRHFTSVFDKVPRANISFTVDSHCRL